MLVYLSYVPIDEDEGKIAKLPDGSEVNLRSIFPASGCYEISTRAPLWTAPWDGGDNWSVSDDCRYLVRWNRFGDGSYQLREDGELSWGLKFYDRGREVRTYDVSELVDFPSLMPYTTSDWHHEWIEYVGDLPTIHDREFVLHTTTHEKFRFDIRTGAIFEEFRMWKMLSREGVALAAVTGVGLISISVRRRRPVSSAVHGTTVHIASPRLSPTTTVSMRLTSFSLRSLLAVTTAVAFVIGIGYRWPHIVLLFGSIEVAVLLTRQTIRHWRLCRTRGLLKRQRVRSAFVAAIVYFAWAWCYLLSVGPVMGLIQSIDAPDDVHWAIILTVYRPLLWFEVYAGTEWLEPLEWYFRAWGIR